MPENLHKHMQIDGFNIAKVIKAGMYGDLAVLNDLPIRRNRLHHSQPGWITDEWRNTLSIYFLSKKIKGTIWKHIRSHDNVTNERGAYCLMEIKMVSLQRAKFKDFLKPKVKKKLFYTSPLSRNFIAATHNGTEQFVWPPHICMHDWQHRGISLMRQRMVVSLHGSPPTFRLRHQWTPEQLEVQPGGVGWTKY